MITGYLSKLTAAKSVDEAWELHVARMKDYGFDRIFYGFTRPCGNAVRGDHDDLFILSNLRPGSIQRLIDIGSLEATALMSGVLDHRGSISYSSFMNSAALKQRVADGHDIDPLRRAFEKSPGYLVSFRRVSPLYLAGMALTARHGLKQRDVDALWADQGEEIESLCNIAHLKISSMPASPENRAITARQREVLELAADGKTNRKIADILGVSVPTVEKHLRLARDKLGAETTAQAVLKAVFRNQICVLDDVNQMPAQR